MGQDRESRSAISYLACERLTMMADLLLFFSVGRSGALPLPCPYPFYGEGSVMKRLVLGAGAQGTAMAGITASNDCKPVSNPAPCPLNRKMK